MAWLQVGMVRDDVGGDADLERASLAFEHTKHCGYRSTKTARTASTMRAFRLRFAGFICCPQHLKAGLR